MAPASETVMPGIAGAVEALDQPTGNSASTSALEAALVGVPPELSSVPPLPAPPTTMPRKTAVTAAMPKPTRRPRPERRSRGSRGSAVTAAGRSVSRGGAGGGAAPAAGLTDEGITVGASSSSRAAVGAGAAAGGAGAGAGGGEPAAGSGTGGGRAGASGGASSVGG